MSKLAIFTAAALNLTQVAGATEWCPALEEYATDPPLHVIMSIRHDMLTVDGSNVSILGERCASVEEGVFNCPRLQSQLVAAGSLPGSGNFDLFYENGLLVLQPEYGIKSDYLLFRACPESIEIM